MHIATVLLALFASGVLGAAAEEQVDAAPKEMQQGFLQQTQAMDLFDVEASVKQCTKASYKRHFSDHNCCGLGTCTEVLQDGHRIRDI